MYCMDNLSTKTTKTNNGIANQFFILLYCEFIIFISVIRQKFQNLQRRH